MYNYTFKEPKTVQVSLTMQPHKLPKIPSPYFTKTEKSDTELPREQLPVPPLVCILAQ